MVHPVVTQKSADVSEVPDAFIVRANIPESSHFHTRRRENLKSHSDFV
jgi:hypothetical protein